MRQHDTHIDSDGGRVRQGGDRGGDQDSHSGRGRQGGDRHYHGYDGTRRSSGGGQDNYYRQRTYNNNRHRGAYDMRSNNFPPDRQWHDRGSDHRDRGGQHRGGGDHYWDYNGAGGYGGGYNRRKSKILKRSNL